MSNCTMSNYFQREKVGMSISAKISQLHEISKYKVFPVISRRFLSSTDRQSGLEQITWALVAGIGPIIAF